MWEKRFEVAKEELREEMRHILSNAEGAQLPVADHDLTETSLLSVYEGCECNTIWSCCVVLYYIGFTIENKSLYGHSDSPWRAPPIPGQIQQNKIEMSAKGWQLMERFNQQVQCVTNRRKLTTTFSDSEWQELLKIYRKLWPFNDPKPEALDWWSRSTTELVQAVSWTDLIHLRFN